MLRLVERVRALLQIERGKICKLANCLHCFDLVMSFSHKNLVVSLSWLLSLICRKAFSISAVKAILCVLNFSRIPVKSCIRFGLCVDSHLDSMHLMTLLQMRYKLFASWLSCCLF